MAPLISIIVPVYHVEPYLERSIESILHQTYQNINGFGLFRQHPAWTG